MQNENCLLMIQMSYANNNENYMMIENDYINLR